MSDLPKDYVRLPFPVFQGSVVEIQKKRWEGVVADRARIYDRDFHGGKTEAIRLIVGWTDETIILPGFGGHAPRPYTRSVPVAGPWIEFRNFKEANAFVQAYKRLGQ